MTDASTVYVVHCVDTEGPLHESVEATFERLEEIFGLHLDPSLSLLHRLQAREVDLGGSEEAVARVVSPQLLAYNDTWDKIDLMLGDCMSPAFRGRLRDQDGGGWLYNWFCVDHVSYAQNPRRRDLGYHNVFDHYRASMRESASLRDGLHFHYHPHNFRHEAHRSATHWWASSDTLQQVITRRVIDREWFPAAHRPAFHVIRPESHWFLEQYIPFDYANQATVSGPDGAQAGVETGRWGDWRRAPADWQPYHPHHDDYQRSGSCRRWVARCLNVGTRYRLLREEDVRQAFSEAREGRPVILSFANHDHRDLRPDVDGVRDLLDVVQRDFPDVGFKFSEALEAMRSALELRYQAPCDLDLSLAAAGERAHVLEVSSRTPSFGPQPWLALKTRAGSYHTDNFDTDMPHHRWRYVLDQDTFPLDALETVGVAAANPYGISTVSLLDARTGSTRRRVWNDPAKTGA
jgi:hypothetical protein